MAASSYRVPRSSGLCYSLPLALTHDLHENFM
jgi:hypothetical protein